MFFHLQMFKYILLGLLLVHTICAQPVKNNHNIKLERRDGRQFNPQEIANSVVTNTATALQTAASQVGSYDPIATIQNTAGSLSQGVISYLPGQSPQQHLSIAQQQQQLQKLYQQQNEALQQQQYILQQEKIKELEEKLKSQTDAPLLAIKTPILSAGVNLPATGLVNSVVSTVGSVGGLIPNILG